MAKVSPIPKGSHTITPGLAVRNAAQAIDFYKKAFGAKEKMRMPGPDGKIMHADIQIGDSHIMVGEENVQMNNPSLQSLNGSPISLYVYVRDAYKIFNQAVKAGDAGDGPVLGRPRRHDNGPLWAQVVARDPQAQPVCKTVEKGRRRMVRPAGEAIAQA